MYVIEDSIPLGRAQRRRVLGALLCLVLAASAMVAAAPPAMADAAVRAGAGTTSTELEVEFEAGAGVGPFEVYVNDRFSGNPAMSPFVVPGLSPATSYTVRVMGWSSGAKVEVGSTTMWTLAAGQTGNGGSDQVQVTKISGTTVSIAWASQGDGVSYEVWLDDQWTAAATTNAAHLQIEPGAAHQVTIKAWLWGSAQVVAAGTVSGGSSTGGNGGDPGSSIVMCLGQVATIIGTADSELLTGTEGDDVIWAGAGNDVVYGYGGNDLICAGRGHDKVIAGPGHDHLIGYDGDDRLFGGSGKDVIKGHNGDDFLHGGRDNDILIGGGGRDHLRGGMNEDMGDGRDGRDLCEDIETETSCNEPAPPPLIDTSDPAEPTLLYPRGQFRCNTGRNYFIVSAVAYYQTDQPDRLRTCPALTDAGMTRIPAPASPTSGGTASNGYFSCSTGRMYYVHNGSYAQTSQPDRVKTCPDLGGLRFTGYTTHTGVGLVASDGGAAVVPVRLEQVGLVGVPDGAGDFMEGIYGPPANTSNDMPNTTTIGEWGIEPDESWAETIGNTAVGVLGGTLAGVRGVIAGFFVGFFSNVDISVPSLTPDIDEDDLGAVDDGGGAHDGNADGTPGDGWE